MNKIGRYEIIKELGRGGMATVFLARDPRVDREVAVKVLPREFLHDPSFRSRFEREGRTIAALEHPAIVPVFDFGEEDGQPYMVMRYMAGGSLAEKLGRGPLTLETIIPILQRIAPAIDEAHQLGIIHRDLKPGNILFDQRGLAYIGDFGIAKLTEGSAAFTGSGILGTPAYMSPEQARGRETLDGRSDVYSLGVVLFEMLAGKLPFEADTPMGMAMAHVSEPVPDVRTLNRDLPPACSAVIEQALAKERAARHATAVELAEALAAVEKEPAARAPAQPPVKLAPRPIPPTRTLHDPQAVLPPPAKPAPRRRWLSWAGVAVAAGGLLVLVVAFVLMSGFPGANSPTSIPTATASQLALVGAPSAATSTIIALRTQAASQPTAAPSKTPLPTAFLTITPLPASLIDASGAEMALIPAGSFEMGSAAGFSDETPVHTVFLDEFYIDLYEVTNEQFAVFLNEAGNQSEGGVTWLDAGDADVHIQQNGGSQDVEDGFADHPVIEVSWFGAQAFCEWRGARLPTEAEWEKAARGGLAGATYPWGNEAPACDLGAFNGTRFGGCGEATIPVGSFSSNGYGLFDIAGNVWEWVADWYDGSYYDSASEWNNPGGPAEGEIKVLRSGSWDSNADNLHAANRNGSGPGATNNLVGFRCARSP